MPLGFQVGIQVPVGQVLQPALGQGQGLGRRVSLGHPGAFSPQVLVEAQHEQSGAPIVHRPQGAHHAGNPREQEARGQADGLLGEFPEIRDGRLARGEHHQLQVFQGRARQVHPVPQGEQPVAQEHTRSLGLLRHEHAVGGKMQHLGPGQGFLQRGSGDVSAQEHLRTARGPGAAQGADLHLRKAQIDGRPAFNFAPGRPQVGREGQEHPGLGPQPRGGVQGFLGRQAGPGFQVIQHRGRLPTQPAPPQVLLFRLKGGPAARHGLPPVREHRLQAALGFADALRCGMGRDREQIPLGMDGPGRQALHHPGRRRIGHGPPPTHEERVPGQERQPTDGNEDERSVVGGRWSAVGGRQGVVRRPLSTVGHRLHHLQSRRQGLLHFGQKAFQGVEQFARRGQLGVQKSRPVFLKKPGLQGRGGEVGQVHGPGLALPRDPQGQAAVLRGQQVEQGRPPRHGPDVLPGRGQEETLQAGHPADGLQQACPFLPGLRQGLL